MSFFAVLCALLVEQLKPLPRDNWVYHRLVAWVATVGRNFDAGKSHHVWVVWGVSVGVPTLLVALLYLGLRHYSAVLAVIFDVAVLYLSLGFRQFSHYFTDIRDALERGNEVETRRLLAEWLHLDTSELPRTEVLRHVVEHALLAAHRHVFGVFFWFIVCSAIGLGPAGAVLYRIGRICQPLLGLPAARTGCAGEWPLAGRVATGLRVDRPGAGKAHRIRLRRGRQLRGSGERLAP
jgi:adenosylcobinamide-phosphate synthase